MMTKTLIVTLSLFLNFFSNAQSKKFGTVKKTDKHELLSSSGVYIVPSAELKKGISFIGYRSETSELVYTPINETTYSELQASIPAELKTKKIKPFVSKTGQEFFYYKTPVKTNKPMGILLIMHNGNYSKITLSAIDEQHYESLEETIYSIAFD